MDVFCAVPPSSRRFRFGEGLELVEQQWLVQEINNHIAAVQVRRGWGLGRLEESEDRRQT